MLKKSILWASLVLFLPACGLTPSLTGDSYGRSEARQIQTVVSGTVVSVRPVKLDGTRTEFGAIAGAALGGVAGGAVGRGYGSVASAVASAVAGGVIGTLAEQGLTAKNGLEIVVRLERGDTVSIVQEASPNDNFRAGDRVHVTYTASGVARVSPY